MVTQEQIASGELPPDLDLRRTVTQASTEWLTSLKGKSRSYAIYDHRFDAHITPVLGDVVLARVDDADADPMADGLSQKVSAATVNTTIGSLSAFFKFCVSMRWIADNLSAI